MKNVKNKIKSLRQYENDIIKKRDYYKDSSDLDSLKEMNTILKTIKDIKDILDIE